MIYFVHTLFRCKEIYILTMIESQIEKYLIDKCKKADIYIIKIVPTVKNGLPDRLLLYKGFSIFVELKKPNERPRKLQWHEIDTINKYSNALYVDSKELVDKLINLITSNKYRTHTALHKALLTEFKNQMIKESDDIK